MSKKLTDNSSILYEKFDYALDDVFLALSKSLKVHYDYFKCEQLVAIANPNHVCVEEKEVSEDEYLSMVEVDIAVMRHYRNEEDEEETVEPVVIVELYNEFKSYNKSLDIISFSFQYAPSVKEAFMFDYKYNEWTRFLRTKRGIYKYKHSLSSILKCDMKLLVDGFVSENRKMVFREDYSFSSDYCKAMKSKLADGLKKLVPSPSNVQLDSVFRSVFFLSQFFTIDITYWRDVVWSERDINLCGALVVIQFNNTIGGLDDACSIVRKAMESDFDIQEGFVYDLIDNVWIRFSYPKSIRSKRCFNPVKETTDWSCVFSINLGSLLMLL